MWHRLAGYTCIGIRFRRNLLYLSSGTSVHRIWKQQETTVYIVTEIFRQVTLPVRLPLSTWQPRSAYYITVQTTPRVSTQQSCHWEPRLINVLWKARRRWYGLGGSGSGYGTVKGSCERGNEPTGTTKCWEVIEWLHTTGTSRDGVRSMQLVT